MQLWRDHVKKIHQFTDFNILRNDIPKDWKDQTRCKLCFGIFADYSPSLMNHAQACRNPNIRNSANYQTLRDVFPSSCLPEAQLDKRISMRESTISYMPANTSMTPRHRPSPTETDLDSNDDYSQSPSGATNAVTTQQHTTPAATTADSPAQLYSARSSITSTSNKFAALANDEDNDDDDDDDDDDDEVQEPDDTSNSVNSSVTAKAFQRPRTRAQTKSIPKSNATRLNYKELDSESTSDSECSEEEEEEEEEEKAMSSTASTSRGHRTKAKSNNPNLNRNPTARSPTHRRPSSTRTNNRFAAAPPPHPDLFATLRDLSFVDEPNAAQAEELTSLIADLSDGTYNMQSGHVKDMTLLTEKLLILSRSEESCQHELALAAWQLLPGLYTRLQKKKTPKLHELLRKWTENDSPHLLIIQTAQQLLMHKSKPPDTAPSNKLSHERATELITAGRMGALMRALEQESGTGPVRQSTEEMTQLAAPLHPISDAADMFEDIEAPADRNPISFSVYDLAKAITSLPEVSASGASGWTFKLLRQIYKKEAYTTLHGAAHRHNAQAADPINPGMDSGIGLLHDFYHRILNGGIHARAMQRITMARLILIPKKNGGIRPIAIGDSTLRLMLRVINTKVAKDVGKQLEPIQVAVGTSGGCEIIASLVQHTLTKDVTNDPASPTNTEPHRAAWLLDLPNAFNKVNRRSIATGLQTYCPELLNLFKITYGTSSELRAHTSDGRGKCIGHSMKGCRQGDPLSMLYFAVAIQPALVNISALLKEAHHDLTYEPTTIAYADDIALCGNASIIRDIMPQINNYILEATGITPNLAKCKVIGEGVSMLPLPSTLSGTALCDTGGEIVGVPVGTPQHRLDLCTQMLLTQAEALVLITTSKAIDPQTALALVAYCANAKPPFLCRNVPPDIIHDPLQNFDASTDSAIEAITGTSLTDTAKTLRGLPIALGGCGIRRHAGANSINDFNKCNNLITEFAARHLRELHDTLVAQPALPLTDAPPAENTPAADLIGLYKTMHQELLARTVEDGTELSAQLQANIRSGSMTSTCTYTTSGNWIRWMGGSDQRMRMKPDVFVNALRTRLCLPVCNEHLACPNTDIHRRRNLADPIDLQTHFMHTVLCQPAVGVSGAITTRHNHMRNILRELIRDTAFTNLPPPPPDALCMERKVGEANSNDIVADIIWVDGRGTARQHRYILDITIVEACGRDGTGYATGNASRLAAVAKLALYAEVGREQNTTIVPFALERSGHVGTHATEFLKLLATRDPSNASRIAQFLTIASYVIAKGTAIASEAGRLAAIEKRSH
jgi:hypothetical protein